jgi:hypothetical protein
MYAGVRKNNFTKLQGICFFPDTNSHKGGGENVGLFSVEKTFSQSS